MTAQMAIGRYSRLALFLASAMGLASCASMDGRAPASGLSAELSADFERAARFEFGESRAAWTRIERAALASEPASPERRALARRLASMLGSDATRAAQQFACRQLASIGAAREVPALAALLDDAEFADDARYALESIPGEEANRALRRALANAEPGAARLGLIGSLGERRDAGSTPALGRLLSDGDPTTARAAAAALGKIGNPAASATLRSALESAGGERRIEIAEAWLACADRMREEGGATEAAIVYRRLYGPPWPARVRVPALAGLTRAAPGEAAPAILDALESDDARMRAAAPRYAREVSGEAATRRFAGALDGLDPEPRILLIRALADRADAAARDAVAAQLESRDDDVRLTAIAAMASLGGAESVAPLAAIAASGDRAERNAAERSLARLRGEGVDREIIALIEEGEPEQRIPLIGVIAARRTPGALDALMPYAIDSHAGVREAAIEGAGRLAAPEDLGSFVLLACRALEPAERAEVERIIVRLAGAAPGESGPAARALTYLRLAPNDAGRASLLRVAGELGGERALAELRAASNGGNKVLQLAAIEGLGRFRPPGAPMRDLRERIDRGTDDAGLRAATLDAYIALLGAPSGRPAERRLRDLAEAMTLTEDADRQREILSMAGDVPDIRALDMILPFTEDTRLGDAALEAAVDVASAVGVAHTEAARAALELVTPETASDALNRRAGRALDRIEQYEDHILQWDLAGPFMAEGLNRSERFEMAFPPEPEAPGGAAISWRRIAGPANPQSPWIVDLAELIGGDNGTAYLRTRVWSPEARAARLELGSDDAVKAWLAGRLVHANDTSRGVTPGEDRVEVELAEGWNELLLKIVNGGGGWGASARFRAPDGSRLDGLRVDPDGGRP